MSISKTPRWRLTIQCVVIALLVVAAGLLSTPGTAWADSTPFSGAPSSPIKLAFVHHSVGENWLADDQGALGLALNANNYFVSDTNYGWGPDSIGDRTDIPNWPEWFTGPDSPTYLSALYTNSDQNSGYTRTLADPGGDNQIIMFKSCFPNSSLAGNPNDPPAPGTDLTIANAKYAYNQLLTYFAAHPDKLFVVVTAPPNSETEYGANARAFNNWLLNSWRTENNYLLRNVAVFDFFNVLSGPNNHHRMVTGVEQHSYTTGMDNAYYRTDPGDDHPNAAGSQKATTEFVPLLNYFYQRWQSQAGAPTGLVATPGNGQASIALTPGSSGGSALTNYEFSTDNGVTWQPRTPEAITSPIVIGSLSNGITYQIRLRAVNASGTGVPSRSVSVTPAGSSATPPDFVARPPVRLADTRVGEPVPFPAQKARLPAGGVLEVPVAGANGVPVNAVAAALNVTVVGPDQPGFLTVYPCGAVRPNASNLNYVAGQVVPNAVVSGIGTGGRVCVFVQSATDVVVDLGGWFPTARGFTARPPVRLADTRLGEPVGFPITKARMNAGGVLEVPVAGVQGVAADAAAAALNVTVVNPAQAGFLTVYPCGAVRPNASNLNYVAGQVVPNAVLAQVGTGGRVCIFAQQSTDVVVDLGGWYAPSPGFRAQTPVRVVDTRVGEPVAFPISKVRVNAGGTLEFPVAGSFGVPADASAVVLNVTVVNPAQAGFLTVYPCGAVRPNASNLNYVAGQVVPNAVLAQVGAGGRVCVYAQQSTDVVVDLGGWFPSA